MTNEAPSWRLSADLRDSLCKSSRAQDADEPLVAGRRPRLQFINRSYWPDVEATGQLLTELCEDLADNFDVTVICGMPRKGVGVPPGAMELSERGGVRIRRVRHTRFDKASFSGRLINMLTFQAAATWSSLTAPPADIVVVETDPPFLCLLGRLLQIVRGSRLVCYLQDIYPDIAVALGKLRAGLLARLLRSAFFYCYRCSDAVVVLSRDMRDLLAAGNVSAERLHVVPNWVDISEIYPVKTANELRQRFDLEHKFVVMYNGNLGMSQNLAQVLEAAEMLADRGEIVIAIVGEGADRTNLERIAKAKRLSNVRFLGYQPKTAENLSAADVHLVVMRPNVSQLLMPSKLYGALASGTPVLAIAPPNTELADVIRRNDLGRVASGETAQELAAAIVAMAEQPAHCSMQGAAARSYAKQSCTRKSSVDLLRSLLRDLLDPNTRLAFQATPISPVESHPIAAEPLATNR
jgi:colanic acid biosynthesis glycosyl transferase WcaI